MPKSPTPGSKAANAKKKRTPEESPIASAVPVQWPLPPNPATLKLLSELLKHRNVDLKANAMYIPVERDGAEGGHISAAEPSSPQNSVERTSSPTRLALTLPHLIARAQKLASSQYECRNCIEEATTLLRHSCLIYQSKLLPMLFDEIIVKQLASHIRYYDAMSERTLTLLVEFLVQVLRECFDLAFSQHHKTRDALQTAVQVHLNKVGTPEYAPPEEVRPPPIAITPTSPPGKGKKNNKKKESKGAVKNDAAAVTKGGKKKKKTSDTLEKELVPAAAIPCPGATPALAADSAPPANHGPAKLPLLSKQDLELVCRFLSHPGRNLIIQYTMEYFEKSFGIHKMCLSHDRSQERYFSANYLVPTITRQAADAPARPLPETEEEKRKRYRNALPPLQLSNNCYSMKYKYDCQKLVRTYFQRLRELERRMPYDMQLESSFDLNSSQAIKSVKQRGDVRSPSAKSAKDNSLTLPADNEAAKNVIVRQTERMVAQEWLNIKHMLWRNQLDVEFIGSIAGVKIPLKSVPHYASFVKFDTLSVDELGRLSAKAALNSSTNSEQKVNK